MEGEVRLKYDCEPEIVLGRIMQQGVTHIWGIRTSDSLLEKTLHRLGNLNDARITIGGEHINYQDFLKLFQGPGKIEIY